MTKRAQEDEDRRIAESMQAQESGIASSRLASIYQETQGTSIYSGPVTSHEPTSARRATGAIGGRPMLDESYEARDRFSKAKGISSDQFFGQV
jgi:hypothetical protein